MEGIFVVSKCWTVYFHPTVADAVHSVNATLDGDSPSHLLEQLDNHYGGLENVQDHEATQYLNVMRALKAAKAEVGTIRVLLS